MKPLSLLKFLPVLISVLIPIAVPILIVTSISAVAQNTTEPENGTDFQGTLPPTFPVIRGGSDSSSRFLLRERNADGMGYTDQCLYYDASRINCKDEVSAGFTSSMSRLGLGLGITAAGIVTGSTPTTAMGVLVTAVGFIADVGAANVSGRLSLEVRDCPDTGNAERIPDGFLWRSYKPYGWDPYSWISPDRNHASRCSNPYCITRLSGDVYLDTCGQSMDIDNMPAADQLFEFRFNTDPQFTNIVARIFSKEDGSECLVPGAGNECRSFYYTDLLENSDGCLFRPDNQASSCPVRKKRSADGKEEVVRENVDFYTGKPFVYDEAEGDEE